MYKKKHVDTEVCFANMLIQIIMPADQ